jgi:hypothetical protein
MGKKSGSGSGIRYEQLRSYFLELRKDFFWVKIFKFFDADPGWKKVGSGINIPDPQHCIIPTYIKVLMFLLSVSLLVYRKKMAALRKLHSQARSFSIGIRYR